MDALESVGISTKYLHNIVIEFEAGDVGELYLTYHARNELVDGIADLIKQYRFMPVEVGDSDDASGAIW